MHIAMHAPQNTKHTFHQIPPIQNGNICSAKSTVPNFQIIAHIIQYYQQSKNPYKSIVTHTEAVKSGDMTKL